MSTTFTAAPRKGVSALACLTLVIGLVLTGTLAASAHSRVRDQALARFQRSTDLLAMELERRLMSPGSGLKGARATFAATPDMGRSGFQAYVGARDLPVEFPGVQGFGVIQRVERGQLAAFVEHQRADGAPAFVVHGDGGGPDLYVVTVLEPAHDVSAWGLDLSAVPASRTAIEHAVDTGRVTLFAPGSREGVGAGSLLLAVYSPGLHSTVTERRAALRSLVYAPFNLRELLQGSVAANDGMIDFEVLSGPGGAPEEVLYQSYGSPPSSAEAGGLFVVDEPLELDDRRLWVRARSTPKFDDAIDHNMAITRLVTGSALSLLAAAVVWLLGRGRARALQLALKMTREATEARLQAEEAQREQRAMDLLIRDQFIVSVSDVEGRIVAVNDAMCAISGFTREELRGKDHRVLGSGLHPKKFWGTVWQTMLAGRAWRGEICNRSKAGELYWVDALIAPFVDAQGGVTKFVSIQSDITARKATEVELERQSGLAVVMAAQAEQASIAKSSFLANMSHEIRTPMNGVLGMTELLLGMSLNAEQDHAARTVYRSAEALLVILNDILDFSKIEAGRLEFERLSFDVQQLLYDCMELFRGKVAGRPVELQVRIAPGAPVFVWGDPSRLRQVLTNLVSNAVKFTAAGHVLLELERVNGWVSLRVVDTGPGIPLERQPALFEPFTQADVSTSRRHGGTGLGLAISRRLVEGMGGEITLSSTVGEGTRFEVSLPLVEDLTAAAARGGLLQGRRVLVVDSQVLARGIAGEMLVAQGALVESATDVEGARVRLRATTFDAVLLSDANVDELLAVLREQGGAHQVVSVLWSAAGPRGVPRPQLTLTVPRPCSHEVLGSAISEALSGRGELPRLRLVAPPPALSPLPRRRVLLAEDNAVNQHIARAMLEKAGCEVVVVNDGVEAVAAFQRERWDVIFMDCQMPELDGYEATARIRAQESASGQARTPVIAMTANVMPEDRARCLASGMDEHLAKPTRAHELARVLSIWSPAADRKAS
jgi:PAS domain S-box-containing protein